MGLTCSTETPAGPPRGRQVGCGMSKLSRCGIGLSAPSGGNRDRVPTPGPDAQGFGHQERAAREASDRLRGEGLRFMLSIPSPRPQGVTSLGLPRRSQGRRRAAEGEECTPSGKLSLQDAAFSLYIPTGLALNQ